MTFTIAVSMPRNKCTEFSFGERLRNDRKACGFTQAQAAEAGSPPALSITSLAKTLSQWKQFRRIATLPERDQKAVARWINSLVAGCSLHQNGSSQTGEIRHGR